MKDDLSRTVKDEYWLYLFYVDIIDHIEDDDVREGVECIRREYAFLDWLGS